MKRVFRLPGTRRRADDELDAELRFHLEGRIEDLMEREHLTRDAAEREARRRFGDYDAYRSEARTIDDSILQRRRQMDVMETLKRETRHAARTLVRSPSFSFIAIVTLALGLGAATTIFTLLDRVVLRPLPYPNADRLDPHRHALAEGQGGRRVRHRARTVLLLQESQPVARRHRVLRLFDHGRPRRRRPSGRACARAQRQREHVRDVRHPSAARTTVHRRRRAQSGRRSARRRCCPTDTGAADSAPIRRSSANASRSATRSVEIIGVLAPGASVPGPRADVWVRNTLDPNAKPQNNHTHFGGRPAQAGSDGRRERWRSSSRSRPSFSATIRTSTARRSSIAAASR